MLERIIAVVATSLLGKVGEWFLSGVKSLVGYFKGVLKNRKYKKKLEDAMETNDPAKIDGVLND